MMEGSDSEEEVSGMIRPTLINDLRAILEEYPDNGQIFKELIQNAEDAGATTVRIIYDAVGSEFDPNNRPHFQGPAIYVYNDATFTDKDWEGIKMLRKSVKEEDPMKVGRYGLGFKSVFHITDFPSIVSGDTLLLLDPGQPEDRVCTSYRISKGKTTVRCMKQTFARVFDMHSGFKGTIFRFPLRQHPSKLSHVVYDHQRVSDLLTCFQTEMMLVLVFLKSLETVKIWRPQTENTLSQVSFSVCLTEESVKERRERKACLSDAIKEKTTSSWTDAVNCVLRDHINERSLSLRFVVQHLYLGEKEMSDGLRTLSKDPRLSYLPFVGVSVLYTDTTTEETMQEMGLMLNTVKGHVFCFLPLPLQNHSLTGLPVHVNGFFALSSNRHHLKWPTADEEQHGLPDGFCLWNQHLLKEAIPQVYRLLLEKLIASSKRQGNTQESVTRVYSAFPSIESVTSMWKCVLNELYKIILETNCFFTESSGGRWVTLCEAVFAPSSSEDVRREILEILTNLRQNVCCVPQHVFSTVEHFAESMIKVTPKFVRNVLKKNNAYSKERQLNKLKLLNYILQDLHAGLFVELFNIQLIPQADGTFTSFSGKTHPVFYPTTTFDRALFPGLEAQFISDSSVHDFPDGLERKLEELCRSEMTQVRYVRKDDFPDLVKRVAPNISRRPSRDIQEWITKLWSVLYTEFPFSLHKFQGLRILPTSLHPQVMVEELQSPSSVVLKQWKGTTLNDEIEAVITQMGVRVVRQIPEQVLRHPRIMGVFVNEPACMSVLRALIPTKRNARSLRELRMTTQQRLAFISFISSCERSFTRDERDLLSDLQLFHATGPAEESLVSVKELSTSFPTNFTPIIFPKKLIFYRSETEIKLGGMLGVTELSHRDLVLEALPKLQIFKPWQRDDLVMHVLDSHDSSLLEVLRNTCCIPTGETGMPLRKPTDLIHPTGRIAYLYDNCENRYPAGKFKESKMLRSLEDLGMLKDTLSDREIEGRAQSIEQLSKADSSKAVKRFQDLMNVLEQMNQTTVLKSLGKVNEKLSRLRFLPVLQRPETWPSMLGWKADGEFNFTAPINLCHTDCKDLVGSQRLVLAIDGLSYRSLSFLEKLGVALVADPADVVHNLRAMSGVDTAQLQIHEASSLQNIYEKVYYFLEEKYDTSLSSCASTEVLPTWVKEIHEINSIFQEGQHVRTQSIAFDFKYDCSPYLFKLSEDYHRKYPQTMELIGVKRHFDKSCILRSLEDFYCRHSNETLSDSDIRLLNRMITALVETVKTESGIFEQKDRDRIMLPDQQGKLCLTGMLCFDDCAWMNDAGERMTYVHDSVPKETAILLGVPRKQDLFLSKYSDGIQSSFGQKEDLVTRLKGILQGYPCDSTILNELLQNADDSGATEIHFIKDMRTHKSDTVFSDSWKELQGPALCVYNNAEFTEEDLDGIQNLGLGSKKDDPLKTGTYGIGFNVAYHLTDVPSFLIKSPSTGDVLCAFDPNRKYIPNMGPTCSGTK